MRPGKLLNQLCILKTPSLETKQIQKYYIHNSLEMDTIMTNMCEPMKGTF